MGASNAEDLTAVLERHLNASEGVQRALDRWVKVCATLRQRWAPVLGDEAVDGGLDELEEVFEEYEEALTLAAANALQQLAARVKENPPPPR